MHPVYVRLRFSLNLGHQRNVVAIRGPFLSSLPPTSFFIDASPRMQYAIDIIHNGAINIPPELSRARERYPVADADGADDSEAAVLTYETIRSVQEIRER